MLKKVEYLGQGESVMKVNSSEEEWEAVWIMVMKW